MIAFDNSPLVYFVLGYCFAVIVWLLASWKHFKYQDQLFLLSAGFLIVFMRLPVLIFNQELNADESQMIAHAITLKQFPVYWESVDGTTIGPLDSYLLVLPSFFGMPFDYTTARVMGLFCVLGSLFLFFLSLKNFFGKTTARIGLLIPLFLLTFTQEIDFVHYSSEQLPLLLLCLSLWLLSLVQRPSHNLSILFTLGFVLGLSPFAKIQVLPQAATIGVFAIWLAYQNGAFFRKKIFSLFAGALLFPLLFFVWAAFMSVLDEFWDFYIIGNLIYAEGGGTLWDSVLGIPAFFAKSLDFLLYLLGILILFLMAIGTHFFKPDRGTKKLDRPIISPIVVVFILFWILASLYAATKTGNNFIHYLNFCIYPFGLLGALLVFMIINSWHRHPFIVVIGLFILLPFGISFGSKVSQQLTINKYESSTNHQVPISDVSKLILKHAKAEQRLVVWGWRCKYHVETQMPQGAAEAHFERCIYSSPVSEKYYQGLLEDLENNQPGVFLDAVGPNSMWLNNVATQSHEAFPELKEWIENNYIFVGEAEATRVYVHKKIK